MYGQSSATPLVACLLMALVRFFMIIFGPTYYLVGHSCLFVLLACYFSHRLIDRFAPLSQLRQKSDDEEDIQPDGLTPTPLRHPTVVIAEAIGNPVTRDSAARRMRREQRHAAHHPAVKSAARDTHTDNRIVACALPHPPPLLSLRVFPMFQYGFHPIACSLSPCPCIPFRYDPQLLHR